ncbi:Methyltransferase type 12 [Chloroherpeton thalassium ATCC 35110]|uniref:Methyltransferase type 12 n=1 Tax=Chloroherpeton thalassium (strain ATCC 35110 / GB-78) TaxID=517418 RepID=B3QYB5_CHLT3|nr:methyltransferase domain-containing protein [Chloroherpeton thalassium]ACF15081.1 Methyltransferase type 12 [Chloroherpeton thalassium ATCC 35110]
MTETKIASAIDALKHELASQYELSEATYAVSGKKLKIFSVADSYALLDRITDEEFVKDEQMPYWAEIWPASMVLAKYIFEKLPVAGKSCIELGAGVGLVSVAAALAGGNTLATDYAKEAIPFIRLNALLNGATLEAQTLDWRLVTLSEKYDFIFAADVLYERRNQLPILNAIDKLLSKTGVAIVADPRRQIAENFIHMVRENEFQVSVSSVFLATQPKHLSVDVYEIRRGEK